VEHPSAPPAGTEEAAGVESAPLEASKVKKSWSFPEHEAFALMVSMDELVAGCTPWIQDFPRPLRYRYESDDGTVMNYQCEQRDGQLIRRIHDYREGASPGMEPIAEGPEAEEYSQVLDAQGRVVERSIKNSLMAGGLDVRCTFQYEGESERVSWRACDDSDRGAHYEYNDAGRLATFYDAEKKTSSIDELRAWAPPDGSGFWSFVHQYEYDEDGRVKLHRKCNGQKKRWCYFEEYPEYDAEGRLVRLERFDYEDGSYQLPTEPSWVQLWRYDARGLLTYAEQKWTNQAGSRITKLDYDTQGRLQTLRLEHRDAHGVRGYTQRFVW
jgi:YD repeat-containing protein